MTLSRDTDIIKTVIRSPRTAKMIYSASAIFDKPYTNITQIKTDLQRMTKEGFLGRELLPSTKSGRSEFIYHSKYKARQFIPELGEMKSTGAIFRPPSVHSIHTLFVSEFITHMERSAGVYKERVEILDTKRDGYFHAPVWMNTGKEQKSIKLIPDHTFIIEIDGKINLLFFELQNHVRAIDSVTSQTINKTFKEKIMKYKAFQRDFSNHPYIKEIENLYGCRILGFRVLIVTTKNEMNRNRLIICAQSLGYGEMFHFATMDDIRQANLFRDPIWFLPIPKNSPTSLMDSG